MSLGPGVSEGFPTGAKCSRRFPRVSSLGPRVSEGFPKGYRGVSEGFLTGAKGFRRVSEGFLTGAKGFRRVSEWFPIGCQGFPRVPERFPRVSHKCPSVGFHTFWVSTGCSPECLWNSAKG
jgi:hypothetical protein